METKIPFFVVIPLSYIVNESVCVGIVIIARTLYVFLTIYTHVRFQNASATRSKHFYTVVKVKYGNKSQFRRSGTAEKLKGQPNLQEKN